MTSKRIYLVLLLITASFMSVFAQAPKTLSYQGKISDSGGPLNGTYALTFAIYDAATGGTGLWTETSSNVSVTNGNLSITLGKVNPINVPADKPLWMGIKVGANPEVSPRVELTGSMYSLGLALPLSISQAAAGSLMDVINTGTGSAGNFSVNNTGSAANALYVTTNGTGPGIRSYHYGASGNAAHFVQFNATTTSEVLRVVNNGLGFVAKFNNTNTGSTAAALDIFNGGMGTGASFTMNNSTSSSAAININHLGTGNAITANRPIQATQFIGDGSLLTNLPAGGFTLPFNGNSSSGSNAFSITNSATNGAAGSFSINNSTNSNYAISASTTGNGSAVYGVASGSGSAAAFESTGTGYAIFANTSTGVTAIYSQNSGAGDAIQSRNFGTGRAGWFQVGNPLNSNPAIYVSTNGTGEAGVFEAGNLSSSGAALRATAAGSGSAGLFFSTGSGVAGEFSSFSSGGVIKGLINNPSNSSNALNIDNFGVGRAGRFNIGNPSSPGVSLEARTQGTGSAGLFQIVNASNSGNSLQATTNGTGNAFVADHSGSSGNIARFQSNTISVARIDKTGKGFFNGGTQTGGADVAEMFDVEGARSSYEPGDVLVISENKDRTVEKSGEPNSTKIAGVFATKPGVVLTERDMEQNLDDLVPMGVVGVIPTKVCSENGPIKRGDLLVTSSVTGHAMKAIPVEINGIKIYPTGAILGKALENFDGVRGLINVLVNVK